MIAELFVSVLEPAVFDEPLKNRTAIDSSSLIWKCHAAAVPNTLTYRWFYGEREIIYHESLGLRATVQVSRQHSIRVQRTLKRVMENSKRKHDLIKQSVWSPVSSLKLCNPVCLVG